MILYARQVVTHILDLSDSAKPVKGKGNEEIFHHDKSEVS